MKRTIWSILLVGGLFLTLGAPGAFARGMGGGGRGMGGGGRGGGGERGGGEERGGGGERGGASRGGYGGGSRGMESGGGGASREGSSGRSYAGGSSSGGGYHPGGFGAEGYGKSGYGGGSALTASRNPTFSHSGYGQQSGGNFNSFGMNRNNSGASGAQGAAAGAAYANRNSPAASGAQGAFAGAAAAGYHPSSDNYGFYHGSYNGNWGGAAYGAAAGAVARPVAWGAGAWGSGASMYNSGYLPYSNPYASGSGGGGYNYSQPVPVASNPPAMDAPSDADAAQAPAAGNNAEQQLNPAIDAFKTGDNDYALKLVNQAIQQTPGDAVMHEFRALVLFAKRDYNDAAATIHSVLAVGPGWDWTTLSSLYSDINIYTKQLQALEQFVEDHPQDGAAHFLLAYHYMTCGHPDTAAEQFEQVVRLVPSDKVAVDLLKLVSPPKSGESQPPEPTRPKPSSKPVDPASLVGTWRAGRDDGSKFELALPQDSSFTWKFSQQQKTDEFSGTYSVEGNLLVLLRQDGTSLVGQITPGGRNKFNFKMLGAKGDDPGLNFAR